MHAFSKSRLHEQLVAIIVAKHNLNSTGCWHFSYFVFCILFCGASCAGVSVRSWHKNGQVFFSWERDACCCAVCAAVNGLTTAHLRLLSYHELPWWWGEGGGGMPLTCLFAYSYVVGCKMHQINLPAPSLAKANALDECPPLHQRRSNAVYFSPPLELPWLVPIS